MSESVCPKCGAGVRSTWHSDYNGTATDYLCGHTIYADGTKTQDGEDCLRRQLAQRDRRIRVLEEQNDALVAAVLQVEAKNADLQARIDAVAAKCVGRMVELLAD